MALFSYWKLLLVFIFHQACSLEIEPAFKTKGSRFSLGNCFGQDAIVAYRCSPDGCELLGNSSDASVTPPGDMEGRVQVTKSESVVGVRILDLTYRDAGIYRKECWRDGKQFNNGTLQLHVCGEESIAVQIRELGHRVQLQCNVSGLEMDGSFVRWYHEVSETFELQLFLDSSVSLLPLVDEMKGVVKVGDDGASLSFDSSLLKNSSQFYCMVGIEDQCIGYQNIYQLFDTESEEFFVSQGDRVVLPCEMQSATQHWRTPMGTLNATNPGTEQMFISGDSSLVISAAVDKNGGEYSCVTDSQDIQYSVVLCPSKRQKDHVFTSRAVVKMECDWNKNDSNEVRWYQEKPAGRFQLILNSNDKTIPIPEHLRGRVVPTSTDLSLEISDLRREDQGVYFCVVLGDVHDYLDDYEYEDTDAETDENYEDGPYWQEHSNCLVKQKHKITFKTATKDPKTFDVEVPPAALDVTPIAIGAAVGTLALAAVIIVVVLMKRKRQRASQDVKVDPDCTQSLTHTT